MRRWSIWKLKSTWTSTHDHSATPATPAHARGLVLKWVPFTWGETSAGFKFQTSRDTISGSGSERSTQVQALLTHNYASGVVLHANLGHQRSTDSSSNHANATTWALGGELPLVESVKLVGDVYGDSHSRPGHQIGLRWTLKESLKLSAAVGRQNSQSHTQVGMAWEF